MKRVTMTVLAICLALCVTGCIFTGDDGRYHHGEYNGGYYYDDYDSRPSRPAYRPNPTPPPRPSSRPSVRPTPPPRPSTPKPPSKDRKSVV